MKKMSQLMTQTLMTKIITEFKNRSVSEKYESGIVLADPELAFIDYVSKYGDLIAGTLLELLEMELVTEDKIAKLIVQKYYRQWIQLFRGVESEYEILWNVDGTEVRTIVTEFGKKITDEQKTDSSETITKSNTNTTEQLENGVTHREMTDGVVNEQLVDGHSNRTDDLNDTQTHISDKVTKTYLNGYDESDDSPSQRVVEDGGSDGVSHTGTSNTNISDGKRKSDEDLDETVTNDLGKIQVTDSGSDTKTSRDGTKEETESGTEKVTETFERGGNIGVTKSTELLESHMELFASGMMNLLNYIYKDLNAELTVPIWR